MEGNTINIWKRLQRGVPKMHRGKRLRVSEVNPHLICVLCGGYYIDATTITECLHTFCKTCIVGYLEASKHCPVCDNLVHKTKPHLRLRPDHILQDLVYKLVPGLFQDEMKKRREFYKDEIQQGKLCETGVAEERERIIYSADELISLVLELSADGQPPINPGTRGSKHKVEAADRRYLQCPANITIHHLKKFIRMKLNLCDRYQVDFYHTDESLHEHYSLVDVAYIYSWRRQGPLRLYYTVFTNPAKKFKAAIENLVPMDTDIIDKSDSRGETSGYLSSDDLEKSHDRSRDSGVSLGGDSFVMNEGNKSSCSDSMDDSGVAMDSTQNDPFETVEERFDKMRAESEASKPVNTNKQKAVVKRKLPESDKSKNVECAVESVNKVKRKDKTGGSEQKKNNAQTKSANLKTNMTKTEQKPVNSCVENSINKKDKTPDTISDIADTHSEPNPSVESKPDSPIKKDVISNQTKAAESKIENVKEIIETASSTEPHINELDKKCVKQNNDTDQTVTPKIHTVTDTKEMASSTDSHLSEYEAKCEKPTKDVSIIREKPVRQTAETSTCTSPIPFTDVQENVTISKLKPAVSDDDVSEPVVSSTQNTQGCQTEPPESYSDTLELPHSSEAEETGKQTFHKSTVDVSCGTDTFETDTLATDTSLASEVSVESVSVSTETEHAEADSKGKVSKDCSTDVYDLHEERKERKSVDCSTDFADFPGTNNKRKALSVDCSTGMEDFEISSTKRKVVDSATVTESKCVKDDKKVDIKITKRSFSYAGNTSTPKSAYQAQPLSPTKITLKFTPPKSPIKTLPKSPVNTRVEPSGFQSQYQSFVMELPNKTYDFNDDDPPNPVSTSDKPSGPVYQPTSYTSSPNTLPLPSAPSAPKKVQTKTGRPRGRPPKNRPVEVYVEPPKEKKHKSRSHSPKHRKHSEKDRDRESHKDKHSASVGDKRKSVHSPGMDTAKQTSTPYTWINKIDTGPKHTSERKLHKSKSVPGDKSSAELKIPKQFLFFSNGQYTLASESTLATLKQSSPVSPTATKTVSVADTKPSSYGDKHYTSAEKPKEKKAEKSAKSEAPKVFAKSETKTAPPTTHVAKSISPAATKAYVQSESKIDSNQNRVLLPSPKPDSNQHKVLLPTPKPDSNQSKGLRMPVPDSNQNKTLRTPTPTKSQHSPVSSSGVEHKDERKASSSPAKSLEYRHQSPFFASMSGAKLGQTHRIGTHLNIPNLSSHFSGTHHLYAHARYSAERLAQPSNLYRSFSMTEKSPAAPIVTHFQDKPRMDAVPSPCGYLTPFPAAYLGLSHMHNHMISSLPPAGSPKGYSPDSTRSPVSVMLEQNTSIGNSPPQTSGARNVIKSPSSCRKGKEKSIDNIITAITEMRAKKEEQLNGIDLSTKSSRHADKSSPPNNRERLDKYAFTDEDDVRVAPSKSIYKSEHVPVGMERKSAV